MDGSLPWVEGEVRLECMLDDCRAIASRTFPLWKGPIELSVCSGGITNSLVRARDAASGADALVRVYGRGTDVIVDRQAELENALRLHAHGLGPQVYARFANGFVYGFVQGEPLDCETVRRPEVIALVTRRLAQLHAVPLSPPAIEGDDGICLGADHPNRACGSDGTFVAAAEEWVHARHCRQRHGAHVAGHAILRTAERWLAMLPGRYACEDVDARFRAHVSVASVRSAMAVLEEALCGHRGLGTPPLVFGHNDLLPGNIVLAPDRSAVHFIDFEYGGANFRGFDIGNHFCEWAGADCDYARYPDADTRARWVHLYVRAAAHEGAVLDADRLLHEAELGALLSHLYWGVWGLLQAHISAIDFDYMAFGIKRLSRLAETLDATVRAWALFVSQRRSCHS